MSLQDWGWDDRWAEQAVKQRIDVSTLARVVGQDRGRWSIQTASGPQLARLPSLAGVKSVPVVGDWVTVEPGPMPTDSMSILSVLPRRSRISRGAAGGGGEEQILAANVDTVWIVHGLDTPFNPRRLERYLAVIGESGASPEVILTKVDLAENLQEVISQVKAVGMGVPIRTVSKVDAESVQALLATLNSGCTVSLLGPSGVGKSTLVNLLGQEMVAATGEVREGDRKGRHTTARRELFRMPCGALLLDTPGTRELRIWEAGEGLKQSFPDIDELAQGCKFRDCHHAAEPGCAVQAASKKGDLDADRLESFRKLQAEAGHEVRKHEPRARAARVAEHKTALKTMNLNPKYKKRS